MDPSNNENNNNNAHRFTQAFHTSTGNASRSIDVAAIERAPRRHTYVTPPPTHINPSDVWSRYHPRELVQTQNLNGSALSQTVPADRLNAKRNLGATKVSTDSNRERENGGYDCPIGASLHGRGSCSWRQRGPQAGFPELFRVRAHIGEHGLLCSDCGRCFNRHSAWKAHRNTTSNTPCSDSDVGAKPRAKFQFPINNNAAIEAYFQRPSGKNLPDQHVWLEGYKALNPSWKVDEYIPSPYLLENLRSEAQTAIPRPSATASIDASAGMSNTGPDVPIVATNHGRFLEALPNGHPDLTNGAISESVTAVRQGRHAPPLELCSPTASLDNPCSWEELFEDFPSMTSPNGTGDDMDQFSSILARQNTSAFKRLDASLKNATAAQNGGETNQAPVQTDGSLPALRSASSASSADSALPSRLGFQGPQMDNGSRFYPSLQNRPTPMELDDMSIQPVSGQPPPAQPEPLVSPTRLPSRKRPRLSTHQTHKRTNFIHQEIQSIAAKIDETRQMVQQLHGNKEQLRNKVAEVEAEKDQLTMALESLKLDKFSFDKGAMDVQRRLDGLDEDVQGLQDLITG